MLRHLLRYITLRHITGSPLRSCLTVLGTAVAVAGLVAITSANGAVLGSYEHSMEELSGRVDLEVGTGDNPLPETLLEPLTHVRGVNHISPVIEAKARYAATGEPLLILGLDLTGDSYFRVLRGTATSDIDPLEFLNCRRCLLLAHAFAARHNLHPGMSIDLVTPQGVAPFLVKDVLQDDGAAQAFGGSVAVMYLDAAQLAFARTGLFDRIDIALTPGVARADIEAHVREVVGPGVTVERPARRGERNANMMARFRVALQAVSTLALLVSMFMIYNTVGMSVAQRRREIGILRALGLYQKEIRSLFVGEAMVLGALGGLLGIGLGSFLAHMVLQAIGATVSSMYVEVNVSTVDVSTGVALAAMGACLAATALSAYVPAREAAQTAPALSMQRAGPAGLPSMPWRRGLKIAPVLGAVVFMLAQLPHGDTMGLSGHLAMILTVAAVACLVPGLLQASSRLLRRPLAKLFGVTGLLAADNLVREGVRAVVTVAALMVGLSLALASSTFVNGFEISVDTWLRQAVPADLLISGSGPVNQSNIPLPAALKQELMRLPFGMDIESVNVRKLTMFDRRITLLATETPLRARRAHLQMIAGPANPWPEVSAGRNILVSDNLAQQQNIKVGDTLNLPTPRGLVPYHVVGIWVDYSSDAGVVMLDRRYFVEDFLDDSVDSFEVYLHDLRDMDALRHAMFATLVPSHDLFLQTNQSLRERAQGVVKDTFRVTSAMSILAVLVALLGVMNTLVGAVLDRTRELGVLRAVGMDRLGIVRVFVLEALLLAAVAAVLAVGAGALLGWLFVAVVNVQGTGWHIGFHPVWSYQAWVLSLGLVASAVAAIWPAWRGARRPITEALMYE